MNARLLAAFLCLATLGTGCIIVDNDGTNPPPPTTGSPGHVTFLWRFGPEGNCDSVPAVKSIKLTIPGETLDSNGFYACNTAGVDGITLRNFRGGTYNYTIQGLDSSGTALYTTSGSFSVNGDTQVRVDFSPTSTGSPGHVTFLWTFGPEGRCADVPSVKSIKITIPGQTLDSNGYYACNTAGVDGITLRNFQGGTYNYTIQALDSSGAVLYTTSGSLSVNGNKQVYVDLTPGGKTYAYYSWYFPAKGSYSRPTCAQANVTSMQASINGGAWFPVSCQDGTSGGGIPTPYLEPGTHTIRLVAYGYDTTGRNGMPLYNLQGSVTTQQGTDAPSAEFGFFALGGMSLRWDFWDGYQYRTCTETGVTQVVFNLLDLSTNTLVFGEQGVSHGCGEAPVVNQFMKPGDYKVYIRGYVGTSMTYSNESNPTNLTVKAFEQKVSTDTSTVLVMSKLQ